MSLDSIALTARLPPCKLDRLITALQEWGDRTHCTKQQLLSLIGVLQHASTVIRFGRAFLCSMIDLAKTVTALHHQCASEQGLPSRSSMVGILCPTLEWAMFLLLVLYSTPEVTVFTDASGSWGCGGLWDQHWFQLPWSPEWSNTNITAK